MCVVPTRNDLYLNSQLQPYTFTFCMSSTYVPCKQIKLYAGKGLFKFLALLTCKTHTLPKKRKQSNIITGQPIIEG